MSSTFPAELPDRPSNEPLFAFKKRFSQRLNTTRSEKGLSAPLSQYPLFATAPSQTQSHDEYLYDATHASHATHSAGQHRGSNLGTSVKRGGFVPKLKHAVSSLRISKNNTDRDPNFSQSEASNFAYPDSSAPTPQPSFSIKRKPVSLPASHVGQDALAERFARLRAPRSGKSQDAAASSVGQPLSPYFTAFPHPQSPLIGAPGFDTIPPTNITMNDVQTLPYAFELPAQPRYSDQSLYQERQQSGLDLQHPIVIDDDDYHHTHTVSEVPGQQRGARLYAQTVAPPFPPSGQYHDPNTQSAQPPMALTSGYDIADDYRPTTQIIWPHELAVTRRAGRFIDSTEAIALQEQLDRNLAQQLQYEEDELYNATSSLMVPFRLDTSARPAPYSQNGESSSTSSGTREAPIDLDSDDEWWDTESTGTATPTLTLNNQWPAESSGSRRLSDEMDWQPSSPTSQSQIDEDATLAQLLQEEEDQQATPPTTRECPACNDQYPTYELPSLANCVHEPQTCGDCFAGWIAAQLEGSSWQNAKCPETKCNVQIEYHEIQQLASPATFAKYDTFITRAACNDDPLFRWCSSCTSGQIHDSTSATGNIFTCFSCGHKVCTIHENTWHKDETCDEYEYRTSGRQARDQKAQEAASVKAIGKMSKECPGKGCKWRIEKNEGCDHMTCSKCRYEFCWICLCDYNKVRSLGNAAHKANCLYHSERLY